MKINDKLMKQVTETKYLTVENSWRYRVIMRYFYEQYERINYPLYKEDVFHALSKDKLFSDYTLEQCSVDLETLREWKNLEAIQDVGRVRTPDEFKNRKFRYELTQYSIEIERMTIKLENLKVEGASLEANRLERIKNTLMDIKDSINKDDKTVYDIWTNLISDFENLNINYQDYIRQINGLKAEDMMNTGAYLMFKDKLIEYLKDFIRILQNNIYEIEDIYNNISKSDEKLIFEKVSRYYENIPRIDKVSHNDVMSNIVPKWYNIKRWFIGGANRDSEVEKLLNQTSEIIRKVTRYAVSLSESINRSVNRKEEYRRLSELFMSCNDMDSAHCLSAYVFGMDSMRHIQGDFERNTESVNSTIFDEKPFEVSIKPRVRTYREKSERNIIVDKTKEKKEQYEAIIIERKKQESMINKYIVDGKISFSKLGVIDSYVRKTLLTWLSNALGDINFTTKNENGNVIRIINPNVKEKTVVVSEDGSFEMPSFILEIV